MTNGVPTPENPNLTPEQPFEEDVSSVEADREAYEQSAEHEDDVLHAEEAESVPAKATRAVERPRQGVVKTVAAQKDPVVIEVERILEEGIGSFYSSLSGEAKSSFRTRGEEVSREIAQMVSSLHIKMKQVISLIRSWLKTIPGVNVFFLEQEIKIKADKILELAESKKEEASKRV